MSLNLKFHILHVIASTASSPKSIPTQTQPNIMTTTERTDAIHHSPIRSPSPSPYTRAHCLTSNLPYSSHPIYNLRRCLIVADNIGALCCFLGTLQYYTFPEFLGGSIIALAVSALFCLWDLFKYARKKAQNPDHDPAWPSKMVIGVDLALAVLLFGAFWVLLVSQRYLYQADTVWIPWGELATVLTSCVSSCSSLRKTC